jgi:hypothetical protein
MTLPYDYSRCGGYMIDGELREGCEDCLRRTSPGRPDGLQSWIIPPELVVFECEWRIPPKDGE